MTFDVEPRYRVREHVPPLQTYLGYFGGKIELGGTPFYYYFTQPYRKSCLDELHRGPPYKSGGPLTIKEHSYLMDVSDTFYSETSLRRAATRFMCNHWGHNPDPTFSGFPSWWDLDLGADSAKAWRKYRPGNPEANVAQMMGELFSIPPSAPFRMVMKAKTHAEFLRHAGKDYLNIEWGWKLLLRDVQDIYRLVKNLDKRLKQLRRDNGQYVRRRGKVTDTEVIEITKYSTNTGTYMYPGCTYEFYASGYPRTKVQTFEQSYHSWFSAKFRYFIEDTMTPEWTERAVGSLFGLNINPSLLWELTPWTWLIDWAVNVGDVLSNAATNSVDNLVAEYAFLMATQTRSRKVEASQFMWNFQTKLPELYVATTTSNMQSKVRIEATPYGFGFTAGSLSAKQLKILAALAVSRRW